ncbi:MAG: DNA-processing protein DprA [Polyangiales bacterium]
MATATRTVNPGDPEWPSRLGMLRRVPTLLRVRGVLPRAGVPTLGIVGTRHADEDAMEFARGLAADAVRMGAWVVSGGARGIDAAAHRGALDAGGSTLVVSPSGFDELYPPQHRRLFATIAASAGGIVTECDDAVPPVRARFLARNRIIAAWSDALVVVQAPVRSGALSTARFAKELGVPVFAAPAAPWDPRGAGCLLLLRAGASMCAGIHDVFAGPSAPRGAESGAERATEPGLEGDHGRILGALGRRAVSVDALATRVHLPVPRVLAVLLELGLRGLVEERSPGAYVRAR